MIVSLIFLNAFLHVYRQAETDKENSTQQRIGFSTSIFHWMWWWLVHIGTYSKRKIRKEKGYGKIFQFIIDYVFVSGFGYLVSFEQIIAYVESKDEGKGIWRKKPNKRTYEEDYKKKNIMKSLCIESELIMCASTIFCWFVQNSVSAFFH